MMLFGCCTRTTSAAFGRGSFHCWPYLPGYDFPLPFGEQPSLLGPSCAHWGIRPSLRSAYSQTTLARLRDPIGVAVFHTGKIQLGWAPSLLRGYTVSSDPAIGWAVRERRLVVLPPVSRASSSLSTILR